MPCGMLGDGTLYLSLQRGLNRSAHSEMKTIFKTKGPGLSPSLTLVVGTGPIRLTLAHVSKSYIMEYTWIEN
jgi:hypothetical protein